MYYHQQVSQQSIINTGSCYGRQYTVKTANAKDMCLLNETSIRHNRTPVQSSRESLRNIVILRMTSEILANLFHLSVVILIRCPPSPLPQTVRALLRGRRCHKRTTTETRRQATTTTTSSGSSSSSSSSSRLTRRTHRLACVSAGHRASAPSQCSSIAR